MLDKLEHRLRPAFAFVIVGVLSAGVQTRHVRGHAALGGIGFTVSLFVADLA